MLVVDGSGFCDMIMFRLGTFEIILNELLLLLLFRECAVKSNDGADDVCGVKVFINGIGLDMSAVGDRALIKAREDDDELVVLSSSSSSVLLLFIEGANRLALFAVSFLLLTIHVHV